MRQQGVDKGELRDQAGLGRESRRLRFEAAVADPGASVEQRPGSELDTGHHTETVHVADWRQWEPIGLVLVAETERGQPVAPVTGCYAEDLRVAVERLLQALTVEVRVAVEPDPATAGRSLNRKRRGRPKRDPARQIVLAMRARKSIE